VIGSARLEPPDPRCALAEQIGAVIAARGWTMVTGGYGGLMAVASRAAAEAGGRVVGLPMRGWASLEPSPWSHELRWSQSYPERLAHFLATDAVVVLDGGIGTLAEAAIVWAARQTEPEAPELVFVGRDWGPVLQVIAAHLVIDDRDIACVTICADAEAAAAHVAGRRPAARPPGRPRG
jgi:predicted Rossmann-fold nucleotide-binding protein